MIPAVTRIRAAEGAGHPDEGTDTDAIVVLQGPLTTPEVVHGSSPDRHLRTSPVRRPSH